MKNKTQHGIQGIIYSRFNGRFSMDPCRLTSVSTLQVSSALLRPFMGNTYNSLPVCFGIVSTRLHRQLHRQRMRCSSSVRCGPSNFEEVTAITTSFFANEISCPHFRWSSRFCLKRRVPPSPVNENIRERPAYTARQYFCRAKTQPYPAQLKNLP